MATSPSRLSRNEQIHTTFFDSPTGKTITTTVRYALLIILTIIFLLPFYLILRNGLATDQEITSPHWTFFPTTLHFENIQELFNDPDVPFLDGMVNSAVIGVLQTVIQIIVCMLAG